MDFKEWMNNYNIIKEWYVIIHQSNYSVGLFKLSLKFDHESVIAPCSKPFVQIVYHVVI